MVAMFDKTSMLIFQLMAATLLHQLIQLRQLIMCITTEQQCTLVM